MTNAVPISDSYRSPLRMALVFSASITLFSALVLDGGETAQLSAIGLTVFWASAFFSIWRRPRTPTKIDLLLIRGGCMPLVVGFQGAIHYVWHWRGLR